MNMALNVTPKTQALLFPRPLTASHVFQVGQVLVGRYNNQNGRLRPFIVQELNNGTIIKKGIINYDGTIRSTDCNLKPSSVYSYVLVAESFMDEDYIKYCTEVMGGDCLDPRPSFKTVHQQTSEAKKEVPVEPKWADPPFVFRDNNQETPVSTPVLTLVPVEVIQSPEVVEVQSIDPSPDTFQGLLREYQTQILSLKAQRQGLKDQVCKLQAEISKIDTELTGKGTDLRGLLDMAVEDLLK